MAGLIEDSIRRTAGQVAIGVADGSLRLSYRELGELARVLARQFAQAGITHADPIALYSDNQPEFVIALLEQRRRRPPRTGRDSHPARTPR